MVNSPLGRVSRDIRPHSPWKKPIFPLTSALSTPIITYALVTLRGQRPLETQNVDRHAYHTFQILDHIEQTPLLTNRKVATKLGVSVKLTHELLAQLVRKGWVHIHKHHSRRWDYFLTPSGIAEKARLAYEFMGFTMQFYREARRRSSEVLLQARKTGVTRVAFLGAGELAEIAYLGVQEHKLLLTDVFDDAKSGQEFLGLRVRPFAELTGCPAQRILVTAFDRSLPMSRNYLPDGVPPIPDAAGSPQPDPRFFWIFSAPAPAAAPATGGPQ